MVRPLIILNSFALVLLASAVTIKPMIDPNPDKVNPEVVKKSR